jgi:hypothetical protein
MKMQKLGGYAVIAWICLIVVLMAIQLPLASRYGLTEQGAALDPAKVAAAYSGSPMTFRGISVLEILLGILFLLVVLGLHERMHAQAPNLMRLLIIAASASCALGIAAAMIGTRGLASMAGAADVSVYMPLLVMLSGLSTASDYTLGWVDLLIGLAAISTRALPRFIAYVFLVMGILTIIGFALPTVSGVAGMVISIVGGLLLATAWIWLGIVMLRESGANRA